jgi:hypothetical protein
MGKRELLDKVRALFLKNKVLDMQQLQKAIQTTSRRTVFRYLNELHCLTSYTHTGRYYALPAVVQFDENGFWHYGDVGFSSHGTLIDTLQYVITTSESGKTSSELEKLFRVRVQNSLQKLIKPKKITVMSSVKPMLYLSPDTSVSRQQVKKRQRVGNRKKLPPWITTEVLIACIHASPTSLNMEKVIERLKSRGSSITREQVEQVFEEENLEKKTLD